VAYNHRQPGTIERNAGMSENTSKRSPVMMAVLLVLHAVCGVAILWLLLKLVPQYEKIFKDFGVKLPDMSVRP
jgi:type II secretory pathway component PulF